MISAEKKKIDFGNCQELIYISSWYLYTILTYFAVRIFQIFWANYISSTNVVICSQPNSIGSHGIFKYVFILFFNNDFTAKFENLLSMLIALDIHLLVFIQRIKCEHANINLIRCSLRRKRPTIIVLFSDVPSCLQTDLINYSSDDNVKLTVIHKTAYLKYHIFFIRLNLIITNLNMN